MGRTGPTDGRAIASLMCAIMGIILGPPLGVPGLVLGPIAYFLGKSAIGRIDSSQGVLTGRSLALTGWVLGIVATVIGAVVTLVWFVVMLVAISTPTA